MGKQGTWGRVLLPLFAWLLLVLVLFGIRTHQKWLRETRLNFNVTLNGQPLDVMATLDGKPFVSGQNLSLGSHAFVDSNPKAESYATNFFAWYGQHDLGEIKLIRSTGTLNVTAKPAATSIGIIGPEFSIFLHNSVGTNLIVPTDSYTITAEYPHWSQFQNITVFDHQAVACVFTPQLGTIALACNKDGATYQLQSTNKTYNGNVPDTLAGLPVGDYQLDVAYHQRHWNQLVTLETGTTNQIIATFVLGAAHIETIPSGAEVHETNGNYLGQTPLDLLDARPQTAQLNISLSGYEPISLPMQITADQTNVYRTNLVNIAYAAAMQSARTAQANGDNNAVVQATANALNAVPGDADALALQADASARLAAIQAQATAEQAAKDKAERERLAKLKRPRAAFDELCHQYPDAELFQRYVMKTGQPAQSLPAAIVKSLTTGLIIPFTVMANNSPEPGIYVLHLRQTLSLGILGGSDRQALIVVSEAGPGETEIWFKVMEYQIKTTVVANSLFSLKDNKEMVPVSADKMPMTDALQNQIQEGVQLVTERLRAAVGQRR